MRSIFADAFGVDEFDAGSRLVPEIRPVAADDPRFVRTDEASKDQASKRELLRRERVMH